MEVKGRPGGISNSTYKGLKFRIDECAENPELTWIPLQMEKLPSVSPLYRYHLRVRASTNGLWDVSEILSMEPENKLMFTYRACFLEYVERAGMTDILAQIPADHARFEGAFWSHFPRGAFREERWGNIPYAHGVFKNQPLPSHISNGLSLYRGLRSGGEMCGNALILPNTITPLTHEGLSYLCREKILVPCGEGAYCEPSDLDCDIRAKRYLRGAYLWNVWDWHTALEWLCKKAGGDLWVVADSDITAAYCKAHLTRRVTCIHRIGEIPPISKVAFVRAHRMGASSFADAMDAISAATAVWILMDSADFPTNRMTRSQQDMAGFSSLVFFLEARQRATPPGAVGENIHRDYYITRANPLDILSTINTNSKKSPIEQYYVQNPSQAIDFVKNIWCPLIWKVKKDKRPTMQIFYSDYAIREELLSAWYKKSETSFSITKFNVNDRVLSPCRGLIGTIRKAWDGQTGQEKSIHDPIYNHMIHVRLSIQDLAGNFHIHDNIADGPILHAQVVRPSEYPGLSVDYGFMVVNRATTLKDLSFVIKYAPEKLYLLVMDKVNLSNLGNDDTLNTLPFSAIAGHFHTPFWVAE